MTVVIAMQRTCIKPEMQTKSDVKAALDLESPSSTEPDQLRTKYNSNG
jgi:hypothetical protein